MSALIKTGYDVTKFPYGDAPDPIAWWETTGEDIGLPPGYLEKCRRGYEKYQAEAKAKAAKKEPTP